jgi:ABC-type bacteriocin/lantibiotic exporter with double-glycine peptidase domain
MPAISEAEVPRSITTSPLDDGACLALLANLLGVTTCGLDDAAQHEENNFEPFERLILKGARAGLRLEPVRGSLAQAVWMARDDQPLVFRAREPDERWLVVLRQGFFRVRVIDPAQPAEVMKMSRFDLARHLDVRWEDAEVEFVVASPARAAEGLRGRDEEAQAELLPLYHVRKHVAHGEAGGVAPIRRFFGLLRPEMHDVWTVVVFSVVTGLLYLALPLAVNALVSNLSFGSQSAPFTQALFFIGVALFACLLLSAAVRGLQYHVAEVIQRRLFVRVAADLAHRLPRVQAASLDGVHAPEMVNRFLDVVTVQKSTSLLLLNGVNIVLGGGIGLIVLGFYHPSLLAFTAFILAGIAAIVWWLGRGAVRTSIEESRAKYDVVNWLEEVARYPRLFKGPGGYRMARDRADQLARQYLSARRSHFRVLMRQIGGLLLLEVVASSALLIVGGWLVLSQQLTLGQLVASELIVSAVVASIAKLGKQFEAWYDALAAVDKLGHVTDLEMEREDGQQAVQNKNGAAVRAEGLAFAYPGGSRLFAGLSFQLPPGARVALTGGQGSGCSTLLDLLSGLWQPEAGWIEIDGLDLRCWRLEDLRSRVMILRPQDIFSGTIGENVRLGLPGVTLGEVQDALAQVGLMRDVMNLPSGVHASLVTGGLPLSSRQRARLLLARALVVKPRLLLLDDLFDGMDHASIDELMDVVLDPSRPWTVIIATRDPRVAARCPQRVNLEPL